MEFKLHIGDWSDDGHGIERVFNCKTDAATIECLREVYFEFESKFGFKISEICGEYGEQYMNPTHAEALFEAGIISESLYKDIESDDPDPINASQMAQITVGCLNFINPDYNVRIFKPQTRIPTLHFSGYDVQGRHIDFIGYGVLGND